MTVVVVLISRLKSRRMWLDVSTQVWTIKPGVKRNSGLWDVYPLQTLLWR